MCGRQAGAEIEVTPEMIQAGEDVIDDWAAIEPAFALARRVYIAMAHNAPGRFLASGLCGDVLEKRPEADGHK